jgi:cyclophilin family peptidyl-prolyl cis-trans isomerase
MENLEERQFMSSIQVGRIEADNRGKVLVTLIPNGGTVDPATITKTSVILYTPGADKVLGTVDDVRERENVVWNAQFNRITISSKQKAGTGYRIRLSATRIKSLTGDILDGEYKSSGASGNGTPGGDYNIQTKNDKGKSPTVRMGTSLGTVNIKLNLTNAPVTGAFFIGRANAGTYDNVMVTRSIKGTGGIVAAGSIKITPTNEYEVTSIGEGKTPESTGLKPARGTIAMDRIPIDTTKEGNGFFFNTSANTNDRSVFGTVSSGLSVLDAINNLQTIDLAPQHQFVLVDTKKVPVTSAVTSATFTPSNAVLISRTAVLMKVSSV